LAVIGRTLGSSTWVTRKVVLKVAGQTKWRTRAVTLRTRATTWRTRAITSPSSRSAIWNTRLRVTDTTATTWSAWQAIHHAAATNWTTAQLATPGRPGLRVRVYLPNGADQGVLPAPTSLNVSYVLDDVGALAMDYAWVGPRSSLIGKPCELALEYSPDGGINWFEPPNSRFVYLRDGIDPLDPQAKYSVEATSYLWRLDTAKVLPNNLTNADGQRPFLSVTPGTILKTLLGEAQTRGALVGLTHSSFSTSKDSAGQLWGTTLTIYYDPGVSYLTIIKDLCDQGFLNFRMNGRSLEVYRADTFMAGDRTVGTNQVTLRVARDVTAAPFTRTWEGLANYAYFAGDGTARYEYTNPTAVTPWGRQETFISNGNVTDAGTMATLTQATIAQGNDVRVEYTHTLDFARAGTVPFAGYGLGDYVWAATTDIADAALLRLRVRQITLTSDDVGRTGGNVVLNDRFTEGDIKQKRRVDGITNGASAGTGTGGPTTGTDRKPPAKPGGLIGSSSVYMAIGKFPLSMVHLSWNPVTTNSDGTATDDIDHYDIYRRPFGSTTTSQRWIGRSDDTVQDFSGYAPGSGWWFSVEAWDQTGNRSGRGPEVGLTMARKDTPPQPPSTPTTNTKITVVDVLWNGLPAFGSWPGDFDYVEVHCSTVTGFTPTTATFIGRLYDAGNQVMSTGVPGVPLYFKLIAVDTSGNKSTPSGEAAGTPNLLLGPEFAAGQITYAQIGFKDPGNVVVDGSFETPQFRDLVASRSDAAWSFTTADAYHRTTSATADATVNPATFRTLWLVAQEDAQQIRPGEKLFLRGAYKRSGSDGSMWLVIQWIPSFTTSLLTLGTVDGAWHVVSGQFAAPTGTEQFACYAQISTAATTGDVYLDAVEVRRTVATAIIEDAAITNALIENLAVDDAKIANLDVGKLTAGTVTANLLLAGSIKTSTSGARVEISSTGLRLYNSAGSNTVEISSSSEYLRLFGTGDVSTTSTTHAFQVGATSGSNLIIDNNEVMARDNGGLGQLLLNFEGGRVWLGPDLHTDLIAAGSDVQLVTDTGTHDVALQFFNNNLRVIAPGGGAFRAILASAFTQSSARAVKEQLSGFDPFALIGGARAERFRYRGRNDGQWHYGPMADDLPDELAQTFDDGTIGYDVAALNGVLWEAVRLLAGRVEVLERGAQP
jgi:hypothetical protein